MSQSTCERCCGNEGPLTQVPVKTLTFPCGGLTVGMDLSGMGMGNCQCNFMPPADLYVAMDGNDANDGFTPQTAFATIQAAVDSTRRFMQTDFVVTIHVSPGTYEGGVMVNGAAGHYGLLTIQGQADDRPLILGRVDKIYNGILSAVNLNVKSTNNLCFCASFNARMAINNCSAIKEGAVSSVACQAMMSSYISIDNNFSATMEGTNSSFLRAAYQGFIDIYSDSNIQLNGAVSDGALIAAQNSMVWVHTGATISGSVTGKKYIAQLQSYIYSAKSLTIPGSQAGVTSYGGAYYP